MANRYWVGGAGTWDTTSTTHWSASSGGASGASVPTAADSVFFDQAGTYTVTCTGALTCLNFTVSAGTVTFTDGTTPTFDISGGISLVAATVWSATGTITFVSTTSGNTVTTNGVSISSLIIFNGSGGVWTLGSALTVSNYIYWKGGTFNTNNFNITANGFASLTGGSGGIVSLGSSTITVTTNPNAWDLSNPGALISFNAGTSTLNFTNTAPTFQGGGYTYNNVNFTNVNLSASITGANTFSNLSISGGGAGLYFASVSIGSSQTITGTFTVSGSSQPRRICIYSSSIGTARTITAAAVSLSYVDFRDITAAGASGTWTGTSFGDCGGNSNITFTAAKTVYWNLAGSQNWNATGWCTSSGGSPAIANYPLPQDTAVIDQNSAITTLTINDNWNICTLDMSLRTSALTLATSTSIPTIYGSWKNGTGVTISGTGVLTFSGRSTQQITSNGVAFTQPITVNSATGSVQLQDAFTTSGTVTTTFTSGTIDLNGKTLTTGLFSSQNANTRTLAFGIGNIVCTGTGNAWNTVTNTGLTITGTPVVNVTSAGATAITVFPGPLITEASTISFNFTSGTYALTFLGSTSNVAKNVNFTGFAGTWNAIAGSCSIYGDLTLSTGMTLTASANVLTFKATSGTQTITSNGKTIDFPITINGASSTTIVCADALTLGSTRALTFSLGTLQLKSSATSTVGSFVTSGTTLKYLQSTTAGTQATISDASGTNTVTYLSIKDSNATGGATWDASSATNVNAGNNTGWTGLAALPAGNFFLLFE